MALTFLPAFSNGFYAQECETAKDMAEKEQLAAEAKDKADAAEKDFKNLPSLPAKPAGKDSTAAKTAFDAANGKWIKAKTDLVEANNNLKLQGKDGFSLKQDIANKKQEIAEKEADLKTKDTTSYSRNKANIEAKEKEIRSQMNDFNWETAREKLKDTSYKKFDPSNSKIIDDCILELDKNPENKDYNKKNICISQIGAELLKNNIFNSDKITKLRNELQTAVTATTAQTQDRSGKINYWEEIERIGTELISEIETVQTDTGDKLRELVKLDSDGIRIMEATIKSLQTELATLESQLKPITDAENKVKDTKTDYDNAKTDLDKAEKEAEKDSEALKKWEKDKKEYEEAETKKNKTANAKKDAADEVKKIKPAYDKVVAAKDTVLSRAKTLAALDTLDKRLDTVNEKLMNEAKMEVLENDSKVAENKKKLEQSLKTAQNEEQKTKIRLRWKNYITEKTRPHYIRKRNQAEAERLKAIKDHANVQKFKCFADMAEFINLLGQKIIEVLERKASLVSDMDSGVSEGADEQIPIGEIPPLDESEEGEKNDTPTDEVPDDIAKNTGEVKVIQYFIFLLTNSSNGLYVGSEDSLKGQLRCSFVGGGIGCGASDVISYKKLGGPFASQAEAQQGLCQNITETRYFPLGVGLKGRWQGGNNWYGLWNAGVEGCSK